MTGSHVVSSSPRRALSLRTRVLAGMATVAMVLTVVAVVISATTRSQLIDQIDDRLADATAGDRGAVFDRGRPEGNGGGGDGDGRSGGRDSSPDAPPERQSDFYEGAIDLSGELTTFFVPNIGGEDFAPPDLDGRTVDLAPGGSEFFTVGATEGSVDYRVLAATSSGGDGVFFTALPLNDVESTISHLLLVELLGIAAILSVLGLVTWWMLRLGVRPIKQMTTTATAIAEGDLSARVDESSPASESRELAVALNTMLATIEGALDERAASEDRLRRFVADASHELRTPVTTIRGYAELYRVGGLSEREQLDDAMRRTEQEAQRMTRLVEDMLTLAKTDEHRPIEHRDVDLARLASDAGGDARVVAPDRSIEVDAPEPVVVSGDSDRLRQVFANLVGNAIAHTASGTTIMIRTTSLGENAVVEVIDTGDGMSADVVDRVTERFFRADPSRSRHRGGSGLGLSIVDATVTAHGGELHIESEPGVGTAVRFTIPLST